MHGRERRLSGWMGLGGGGVEELGDFEIGRIDAICAWARMSGALREKERHCGCPRRMSNDHFPFSSILEALGRLGRARLSPSHFNAA